VRRLLRDRAMLLLRENIEEKVPHAKLTTISRRTV
jgi:hypothetical protein